MWGENDVAIKGEDPGVAKTNLERDRKALSVKLKTQLKFIRSTKR